MFRSVVLPLSVFLLLVSAGGLTSCAQQSGDARDVDLTIREVDPKASYTSVRSASKKAIQSVINQHTGQERVELLGETITQELVENIFPAWYGTPWEFHGHTNTPDTGSVACGYFVSTTLKHLGFNLNRYKLAQQASSIGTKSLDPSMKSLWNISVDELVEHFKTKPAGLWTVGLSYHVGFLYWDCEELFFIHSNYLDPVAVVREKATESDALAQSNVFCLGAITHNDWLMKKYISGSKIEIASE